VKAVARYFPMFIDLQGKKVIIISSGEKGRDKAEKMRAFGADVVLRDTYVADVLDIIREDPAAVIVADTSLVDIKRLFGACEKARIPINTVDLTDLCNFIFPSMTVREHLTVAVSTDGTCPTAAVKIRKMTEEAVPSEIDSILEWLQDVRSELKLNNMSSDKRRIVIRELTEASFLKNRPLTKEETEMFLNENR